MVVNSSGPQWREAEGEAMIRIRVLSVCLLLLASPLLAGAQRAANALEAVRQEWRNVQGSNYDALERAPVRHWGHERLQEPLRRTQRALVRQGKRLSRKALQQHAERAYEKILQALKLEAVGTISSGVDGRPQVEPAELKVVLYRSVPSALVLRVMPFGREGKLTLSPVESEGVKIGGQELDLTRYFVTYGVLPIVTDGNPGIRTVQLRVAAAGKAIAVPLRIDVRASGTLSGTVVREGDNAPLAAKIYVEDAGGRLYVLPGERNYRTQSWYAFFQPRFSYVERQFAIPLPPGRYRVTAMKGYGYRNWERFVEIKAGEEAECRIEMEQLCPLEEAGWYSADMHLHGRTTLAMLRAEDVNVAANCHYSSHRPRALPVYKDSSDATHIACSAQEIEHWNFGNVFYFGIPTTALDPKTPDPRMTPFFHYDKQCHRMGGVTIRYLRARPFSPKGGGQQQPELAVSAALGYMDVWSVMDNSMQNLLDSPRARWTGDGWGGRFYEHTYKTWYALLNCGIRITASGGTSWQRLSRIGFNRVYARCPDGLSVKAFAAALKRGDGFVTNGPLLWLRVNERLPGNGLALDAPADVKVSLDLYSRHPIELVEILRNGRVAARRKLDDFDGHLAWEETLRVDEPCWLAARCFGAWKPRYPHSASRNHFAHTNPLVVTVAGRRPTSPRDAARFLEEIDALVAFAPNIPTEALRSRSLDIYRKARQYFADMASQ